MIYFSRSSLTLIILVYNLVIEIIPCHARKTKEYNPEEEKEIPVRIKLLGDLATPHPDSGIELGFVPKQVYYQVRRYDEEKRLPQSEALKEASTPEEIINAPRLREVLTHKKTQEVYEEQGYEDAGYDHGGSARHKQEKVRILADDEIEFGKENVPRHLNKEREELEEEEDQPSEEKKEEDRSESNSDTLNQMNSDVRQRKTKPNRDERKQYDGLDEERKNRRRSDREKTKHSFGKNEKKMRNHSSRKEKSNGRSDKSKGKDSRVQKRRRENHKRKPERRMDLQRSTDHETRGPTVEFDVDKYPFYNKLKSDKYTKHSALKYALNPKEIPVKVPNEMSFYESRKHHCDEVTGPDIEVPNGEEKNPDNSEIKNPNRGKPRMGKLGASIDCLKIKFFGHDPLDSPFFKEEMDV